MQLSDTGLFQQHCFIDGQWVASEDGQATTVTNPYDGSVIGTVPQLTDEQVKRAIESADKAQRLWAKETATTRATILRRWFNLIEEHKDDLAHMLTV